MKHLNVEHSFMPARDNQPIYFLASSYSQFLLLVYLVGKSSEQNQKKTDIYGTEDFHTAHLPGCTFTNFMLHLLKSISTQTLAVQLYKSCVSVTRCAKDDCGDTPVK